MTDPAAAGAAGTADDRGGLFSPELRGASIALFTAVGLSAFEGLAVAAALPAVTADLGGVSLLPWVITAFLLTSGVATVAAGALVDRMGVSPVFRGAVVVFTAGGVLAGVAPSMELVIVARVLQGAGGGAVVAVGLASVGLVYPRRLVGRAFAANATVWGVMGVAGPALAAALLAVASWRWIFLVNLPLGLAALAFGWSALPATAPERPAGAPPIRLDPVVLGLLGLISFGLLYGVDALDVTSPIAFVVVGVAGVALLRRERGRPGALIAPRHVVDAPLGPLAGAMAMTVLGAIGLSLFMPLYLTAGRGESEAFGAWSVLWFTVGWTAGANVSSRLMDRMPALRVTFGGVLVAPVGLGLSTAVIAVDGPIWMLFATSGLAGLGVGAATNSSLTILRTLSPEDELGRASAAHQFVRNTGFSLGNAMMGAVILLVVATGSGDVELVQEVLSGGEGATGTSPEALSSVADGIRRGYGLAVGIGAVIAVGALVPLRAVARATSDQMSDG